MASTPSPGSCAPQSSHNGPVHGALSRRIAGAVGFAGRSDRFLLRPGHRTEKLGYVCPLRVTCHHHGKDQQHTAGRIQGANARGRQASPAYLGDTRASGQSAGAHPSSRVCPGRSVTSNKATSCRQGWSCNRSCLKLVHIPPPSGLACFTALALRGLPVLP